MESPLVAVDNMLFKRNNKTKAYFLERALQGSQLRMAGKLINFLFPDGSELTILAEESDIYEEAKDI